MNTSIKIPLSKRIFDLFIAGLLLVLLSPVLAIVALIIRFYLGKPVLFNQQRAGYGNKPFCLYKFRTMSHEHDRQGNLLPDAERLSRLGQSLRSLSLDELPELFNIFRGEMSLVGPRPLLMKYLPLYSPEQARRHLVLPGMTGWAQVNGRNNLTWEEKFNLDVWYVDHWSFGFDLKILWLTFWKVIKREGINQPGWATAEEFRGSPPDQAEG